MGNGEEEGKQANKQQPMVTLTLDLLSLELYIHIRGEDNARRGWVWYGMV